jgi:hypothetical protein
MSAALEEALAARLIELPARAYQFTHSSCARHFMTKCQQPRRIRLQQRIGAALEERYGTDLTPCLSMLAYHYYAARPIGPAAKAYEYARRAAQRADELFAFEEAVGQYKLAMQAMAPGMDTQRCELLLALGEVQNKMGDSANAVASFTAAAETARRLGSGRLLARAAIGHENVTWRTGTEALRSAALVEEALSLLATADSPERSASQHHAER